MGMIFSTAFAATDISQELDANGWTLKVNNNLTINYDEWTFNETVVFSARTVSQIEWGIDASKYDDKWNEALYIGFKNNIWLATIPEKPISFGYNNLWNFENPVLLTYKDWELVEINGTDNAGTYIYNLEWVIEWAYKIVDSLETSEGSNDSLLWGDLNLLWWEPEEIELNSAPEEPEFNSAPDETSTQGDVLLSDKAVKWAEDFYLVILFLILMVLSVGGFFAHKYS